MHAQANKFLYGGNCHLDAITGTTLVRIIHQLQVLGELEWEGWKISVGDIRSAFLNAVKAPRNLYFRQPKRGLPGLEPGQIAEIKK